MAKAWVVRTLGTVPATSVTLRENKSQPVVRHPDRRDAHNSSPAPSPFVNVRADLVGRYGAPSTPILACSIAVVTTPQLPFPPSRSAVPPLSHKHPAETPDLARGVSPSDGTSSPDLSRAAPHHLAISSSHSALATHLGASRLPGGRSTCTSLSSSAVLLGAPRTEQISSSLKHLINHRVDVRGRKLVTEFHLQYRGASNTCPVALATPGFKAQVGTCCHPANSL